MTMKLPLLPVVAVLALHVAASGMIAAEQTPKTVPKTAAPKDAQAAADAKVPAKPGAPKPWPAPEQLDKKKKDAENRKLFQSAEVLEFTLTSDFKAIDKDRDPASTKMYPATIVLPQADGTKVSKQIQIRGRGHSRRNIQTCDFVPLRLEFAQGQMAGT